MCQILVVEDEKNLASFIAKGLRQNGYIVTIASDGEQALAEATTTAFDVILLDLGLPKKDGWAVLKKLREQELRERNQPTPVIIVTALGDLRHQVMAAGANDYLLKPFRFQALLAAIQQQLDAESPS